VCCGLWGTGIGEPLGGCGNRRVGGVSRVVFRDEWFKADMAARVGFTRRTGVSWWSVSAGGVVSRGY